MTASIFNPKKLFHAMRFSLRGLVACFATERAFRQEVLLAALMIPLALWLGPSGADKAILIGSVFLVLIVELINSAIETLVERISPELHVLSGRAKDIGSAAVFLALMNVLILWGLVLLA